MGPWLVFAALLNGATIALFQGSPLGRDFGVFIQSAGVSMLGLVPSIAKAWRASDCMKVCCLRMTYAQFIQHVTPRCRKFWSVPGSAQGLGALSCLHIISLWVELCAVCSRGHIIHVCICNSVHSDPSVQLLKTAADSLCSLLLLASTHMLRCSQALKPDKFACSHNVSCRVPVMMQIY